MPIERKTEARFLGVIIDESLKWSRHVKTVLSKMSRYVGIMYKIKKLLPLKARLQIYHSFIQSHINFCSLVWGFSCKSNIDAIFTKQKKGMRAVIPGFINYNFRDGLLPGHTKPAFNEYKILTVHNIITLNAVLLVEKIRSFPSLLPPSIVSTIPTSSPIPGSTYADCENWLRIYNTSVYRNSLFFKGPLLYSTAGIIDASDTAKFSIKLVRTKVRNKIIACQGEGDSTEWQQDNFVLTKIIGLRSSASRNEIVKYTEFF